MIIENNFSEYLYRPVTKMQTVPEAFPKIPAGFCVIDTSVPVVLNTVSDSFRLITNKDLIGILRDIGTPNIKIAYINEAKDTFHIAGSFMDNAVVICGKSWLKGWEITNSYSGRLAPDINWIFIHAFSGTFVRTGIPLLEGTRKEIYDGDYKIRPLPADLKILEATPSPPDIYQILLDNASERMPKGMVQDFMKDISTLIRGEITAKSLLSIFEVLLTVGVLLNNTWAKVNYEGCKIFQEILFKRFIKLAEGLHEVHQQV